MPAPTHIDRETVLSRNNPVVTAADPLASLSVGNGHLATTVDVTGMQTYIQFYRDGVPLTTMSDWGWHSFPNTQHLTKAETERTMRFGHRDHDEVYAIENKQGGKPQAATTYFRVNPHRLNLGTIGLRLTDRNGREIALDQLGDIRQEQHLYDGHITSHFTADNHQVDVITACRLDRDAMLYQIKSPLLSQRQASICIRFSYPTGQHADDANDWSHPELHTSRLAAHTDHSATIERMIDSTCYVLTLRWEGEVTVEQTDPHTFMLTTPDNTLSLEAAYSAQREPEATLSKFRFGPALHDIIQAWHKWWDEGGIVDFAACTDPRARELERRVVLSQYLTRINCANSFPPQETGLTYNSWFGRPHLEMTWWHTLHFALWNHPEVIDNMLKWYDNTAYPIARHIALRQGFSGVRWMKMTDPRAGEAPSNTGSFLIWQQPHYIYLAEEAYRHNHDTATLKLHGEQVEQTAEFMAEFIHLDTITHTFQLRGATSMQESMSKDFSYNHPFELAYWKYGLAVAQRWRERRGLQRNRQWDDIIAHMSALPQKDGIYTAGEPTDTTRAMPAFDPFNTIGASAHVVTTKQLPDETFAEKSRSDHPAVLGACAIIPDEWKAYNADTMTHTLEWILQQWRWDTTWGWDYGMAAMAAARLQQPSVAIDILMSDHTKNRYLISGHNYQTADRLRVYLPGNGALLTAIAMMCAGWDGCGSANNPGFPADGTWNVRWENLHPMQ